jgi:hypothetical protein
VFRFWSKTFSYIDLNAKVSTSPAVFCRYLNSQILEDAYGSG